jgi:hypothetical protein
VIYVYLGLVVLSVLYLSILLRRRYKAHYDYLLDCSIPKVNARWITLDELHTYARIRDINADKWSLYAALCRLKRKGLTEEDFAKTSARIRWRWIEEEQQAT